jgi:Domain of unknown function (DUF4129)
VSTPAGDDRAAIDAARLGMVYFLSLSSVTNAVQAWTPSSGPWVFLAWAVALAASLLAAERVAPALETIDAVRRNRILVLSAIAYFGLVLPSMVSAVTNPISGPTPTLTNVLAILQAAFLVSSRLSEGIGAVLTNALLLSLLACLRGGFVGGEAAVVAVASLGCFLVFDHYSRTLAAYPAGPGSRLGLAWKDTAAMVLPAVALVSLLVVAVPAEPPPGRTISVRRSGERDIDWRILRAVMIVWVGGTSAVYVAGRFMRRRRPDEEAILEVLDPIRGHVERIVPPPEAQTPVAYPGSRGRIVRAYARVLSEAAQSGVPRAPGVTADEFAHVVGEPRGPVASLTDAFVRARYGPTDPTETDVLAAESAAAEVIESLRRRGLRDRPRPPAHQVS